MNDLRDLLETVARPDERGTGARASGPSADLDRARGALRHRRRRTLSGGLAALTTVTVFGVGAVAVVSNQDAGPTTAPGPAATPPASETLASPTEEPTVDPSTPTPEVVEKVRLVAQEMQAGPYTFGTTPQGWELQNNEPFAVTIGRIGETNTDPASFVGKLVILLDDLPLGGGEHVTRDGRDLVVRDNGDGYTTISVATRPGEPGTTVRIQFPAELGWTRDAALTFLSSVEVGPDAVPVVG